MTQSTGCPRVALVTRVTQASVYFRHGDGWHSPCSQPSSVMFSEKRGQGASVRREVVRSSATRQAWPDKSSPIQIVVTPRSGNGQARVTARALGEALDARQWRSSLAVFDDLDSVRRWASTDRNDCALIVCVGGDGTQSATALAAIRRSVPFLPVTSGFGNLFGRAVGAPRGAEEALELLTRGRVIEADCGVRNDAELFLCHQGYGLIADVQDAVEAKTVAPRRRWRRWLAYYAASLLRLLDPPPQFRVAVDGREVAADAALVVVANVGAYGRWLPLIPEASPVDGLLDVLVLRATTRRRVVARLLGCHLRLPGAGSGTVLDRGCRVRVSGPRGLEDRLHVMPHRLRVVVAPETVAALGCQATDDVAIHATRLARDARVVA